MSYENSFSLKLKNPSIKRVIHFCTECNHGVETGKFCPNCGTELIDMDVLVSNDDAADTIISDFRKYSENANYLLKNDGSSECTGSGHDIEKELIDFSKRYPTVIFELLAKWDSGFSDPPSKFYVLNGKIQRAKTQVIFDDFDITKLK